MPPTTTSTTYRFDVGGACETCGDDSHAVAYSVAARARLCFRCYARQPSARFMPSPTPPIRLEPPPRHKPTRYAKLVSRVWAALKSASLEATGWEFSVFGGGDPDAPLSGYCPVCRRGLVAVWLLDDPPRIRLDEGCTAGCDPGAIARAMR